MTSANLKIALDLLGKTPLSDLPDTETNPLWNDIKEELGLTTLQLSALKNHKLETVRHEDKRQKTLADELRALTLSRPRKPRVRGHLVAREEAKQRIMTYLQQVRDSHREVLDNSGKFTLLGTSGVKGIGKTEILGQICDSWATEALGDGAKALYVTYNGSGYSGDYCVNPARIGGNYGNAFGHLLLVSCGVPEKTAVRVPLEEAIVYVMDKFRGECQSELVLVICVDEIVELNRGIKSKPDEWNPASHTMCQLMKLQDRMDGKLIFLFTGILDSMFTALKSLSGRAVAPLPLTLVPLRAVFSDLLPRRLLPFVEQPAVNQLILSCAGHPRATVDGLDRATQTWQLQEGMNNSEISAAEILDARSTIVNVTCKFDVAYISHDILSEWFDFRQSISEGRREALLAKGILHTVINGDERVEFLFPLLLQDWARQHQRTPFGFHLHGLYNADLVLAADNEKNMEAVMYHYEALLRRATEGGTFPLGSFYASRHVAPSLKFKMLKSIIVPGSFNSVGYVEDFADIKETIRHLRNGWILVSKKHSEVGIEYLVPYACDDELIVACVQCKFVQKSTNWAKIKDKMLTAVKGLRENHVKFFPVVYTTADQRTMMESTFGDGVYFVECDLYDFTKRLGILRMHTLKLGANLLTSHPYLRISG